LQAYLMEGMISMRKKIALALFFLLITPIILFAQTPTFRDVPVSHFAFEAINWVSNPENGAFMVGDAGNNFNPARHLSKFEAAQIYAMAAGFRHSATTLSPTERDMLTRSFETWRPLLDELAAEFSTWNRTADREIAFLLYREIITPDEVKGFVARTGTTEQRQLLTRQEAVAWMVRLVGQAAHAQATQLPHHTPFRDDNEISAQFRRYVYHARELGIIHGAGGFMNPIAHFTRAEMATVFHNALAEKAPAPTSTGGTPASVSGTIANVFLDTHVSITSATGTETFPIARNAVIMIDNTQRTASFLRNGMNVTALADADRNIISLVARSRTETPQVATTSLINDEGFVTAVSATPVQTVTIRTQRVRITGQIMNDERTFSFAPNAVISGSAATFEEIQVGDIAFFGYMGTTIHTLELMERERTITGVLADVRPPDTQATAHNQAVSPLLIIETDNRMYEFRVLPVTEISRGGNEDTAKWDDLRIGDAITAEVELDRLIRVHAVGEKSTVNGRLNEIRITERNTEITITHENGATLSYFIRPNTFDIYTLRIGTQLRLSLDSREALNIQIMSGGQAQLMVLGFIQAIRTDGTIVVVEGQGAAARTHTVAVPANTQITRGGTTITNDELRVNMNVYIVQTAEGSNIARSVTVLP
jgi:hypothetical protein